MDYAPHTLNRMRKIQNWIEWYEDRYAVLISRASETAGESGWDSFPRVRPCECKLEWRRGNLCLVCDNSRLRACAKGDDRAVDPYALGVPQIKGGWSVMSSGDESAASKRAANIATISREIAKLKATTRQREGRETEELDASIRDYLKIHKVPLELKLVMRAVLRLEDVSPALAHTLPTGGQALYLLSRMVPGRIQGPLNSHT